MGRFDYNYLFLHETCSHVTYMYIIHIQVSHQDITEKSDSHPHDLVNRRFDLLCLMPLSAISWRPVLVVEEAGVPGENHRPLASNW